MHTSMAKNPKQTKKPAKKTQTILQITNVTIPGGLKTLKEKNPEKQLYKEVGYQPGIQRSVPVHSLARLLLTGVPGTF